MTAKPPSVQKVKHLILDYIIEEMKPLRTVESDSFKRLVTGLCPTATVMTRTTLAQLVSFKYDEMISSALAKNLMRLTWFVRLLICGVLKIAVSLE